MVDMEYDFSEVVPKHVLTKCYTTCFERQKEDTGYLFLPWRHSIPVEVGTELTRGC